MSYMYDLVPFGWRTLAYGEEIKAGDFWMDSEMSFKITEELIRNEAHKLWEKNGKQNGKDLENWNLAEMELINIFCFPEREMIGQKFFFDNGVRTIRRLAPMSYIAPVSARQRVKEYLKKFEPKPAIKLA